MRRTPLFLAEPWRSFFSLLQIILLTSLTIPASAAPATQTASRTTTSSDSGMFAALKMSLYQLQTKASLATRAALARLNPPGEFARIKSQFEEPLIATGLTSPKEDNALFQALE